MGFVSIVLCIAITILILWKNSIFTQVKSYELIGEFNSINGLLENAVVKYRGYPIGRVRKIMPNQKNIQVYFFINEAYKVPKGSTVKIVFDGLVGEKYMEIIPNHTSQEFFKNGDSVTGYATSGLSDFIDVGTQNLTEFQSILKNMAAVFGSEEVSYALRELVFSMQDAAENMEHIISELSNLSSSKKLENILIEAETLLSNINRSLRKDDYEKINKTIENFRLFSEDLKQITNDDELKKAMISTLKETHSTFRQSSSFLNTIARIKLLTTADFNYKFSSINRDFLMYKLNFNFWLDNTYLNFGFSNYFKRDKLTDIILGIPFNDNIRFRYGLIKSSPGFGFDYKFYDTFLGTSFNMYNFEDPLFDLSLNYEFLEQVLFNIGYFEVNKPSRSAFLGLTIQPE